MRGIVTLGSPVRDQLAVHPLVLLQVGVLATLGTGRVPGLLLDCLRGGCCGPFRDSLAGPFPDGVGGYVALYSRSDGVVDWRSCLDPEAEVEVSASHCGMSVNAQAYRAVAAALGSFAAVA